MYVCVYACECVSFVRAALRCALRASLCCVSQRTVPRMTHATINLTEITLFHHLPQPTAATQLRLSSGSNIERITIHATLALSAVHHQPNASTFVRCVASPALVAVGFIFHPHGCVRMHRNHHHPFHAPNWRQRAQTLMITVQNVAWHEGGAARVGHVVLLFCVYS